jgi:5-methylcytosine-specific restriction endonuclease McrA
MSYRSYTDEQLIAAVKASFSIAGVLKILRLSPTGCNYKGMYANFTRLGLDTSHFTGQGHLRGKHHSWTPKRPLADILVDRSPYRGSTSKLKRRLLKEGLLVNRCSLCGLPPVWRGERLTMILDHRNGDNRDNRLENLRLLCPNCNSQQPTFAGKNRGRYRLATRLDRARRAL